MADYVFNIAKGRITEYCVRVKNGDPAASRLYVCVLGTDVAQATAQDVDDFGALVTAGAVERTTNGWTRKTIAAVDITTPVPDDTNDRFDVDFVDQTWTAVLAANNSVALIVCYAAVASPTNAQMVPLTHHDFPITTDGTDVQAVLAATGFARAT